MAFLGGFFSIDAIEGVIEQPNLVEKFLGNERLPELPSEIGNRISQYVIENNPVVPWLVQQMTMPHKTLEGHSDRVLSAVFDEEGTKIVTTSFDSTAKIWDVVTGRLIHTLQGHSAGVRSAAFDRRGTKIVTASLDNTAKIWDVERGQLIHTLGHGDRVWSAAFDSTGTKIVTASLDSTAKIWDIGILYYLEQKLSLEQVLLLSYIYAAERPVAKKGHHFDLSKYLHLQSVYDGFPEAIRSVLDKYVLLQEKQGKV